MIKKWIKRLLPAAPIGLLYAAPAMAAIEGLGDEKTAGDLNKIAWTVGNDYLIPIVFGVIFIVVLIVSIKIATSSVNPDRSTDSMLSLGKVGLAAIVAIGAITFMGVLIGIYNKVNGGN